MAEIKVTTKKDDNKSWEFEVKISGEGEETGHKVLLSRDYYDKIISGKNISADKLVKLSIEFLLERESQISILPEFDLKIINNYFPEYEGEIKNRL